MLLDSCLCVFSVADLTPTSVVILLLQQIVNFKCTCVHTHAHTHAHTHTHTHTQRILVSWTMCSVRAAAALVSAPFLYATFYTRYICCYGYGCGVVTLSWFRVSHRVVCSVVSMVTVVPYPRLGEHASVVNF